MLRSEPLVASAPGKLFIFGEYAVLEGAPALVQAVKPRVRVSWYPGGESLVVHPSFGEATKCRWSTEEGAWSAGEDEARLGLVDALLRMASAKGLIGPSTTGRLTIDSSAFGEGAAKLGLGSSAATAVAFGRSLGLEAQGCVDAHRSAQGGVGSGADVLASNAGGLTWIDAGSASPTGWPEDLACLALREGGPSSSASWAAKYLQLAEDDPIRAKAMEVAAGARRAYLEKDVMALIALCSAHCAFLRALGEAHGLAPMAPHENLARWAEAQPFPVGFKPSGAGGGEFGLFFCWRSDMDRLSNALENQPWEPWAWLHDQPDEAGYTEDKP